MHGACAKNNEQKGNGWRGQKVILSCVMVHQENCLPMIQVLTHACYLSAGKSSSPFQQFESEQYKHFIYRAEIASTYLFRSFFLCHTFSLSLSLTFCLFSLFLIFFCSHFIFGLKENIFYFSYPFRNRFQPTVQSLSMSVTTVASTSEAVYVSMTTLCELQT
jgi:hypothetical protein